ncbi:AAA family ATPase [Sphaerotilus sulfidivorans]
MYIDTIRLENIRGFRELEFSFDRGQGQYAGWTVLTGDNGSGKSTVLKAMALLLVGASTRFRLESRLNSYRSQGPKNGIVELHSTNTGTTTITTLTIHTDGCTEVKREPIFSERTLEAPAVKFSCGYGPFRRVSGHTESASELMSAQQSRCFATLFSESASLAESANWLRELKYKSLENRPKEKKSLELVLEVIQDEFLPNQITVDRVDSDGLWLKDRQGNLLSWADMSDGYRAALALLTDILRHMINAYSPDDLTGRDDEGRLFLKPAGVVLIDEIDAHLHPEWQREIGFWLKRHFPNIQFIVTSHSPLICQAADPNGLFVLPEPGSDEPARALTAEEYQEVISSRPDTILRSAAFGLQNTRSPVAVEARSAFADLRTKQRAGGKLTQAEQVELERLRQYINPDEEP